MMEHQNAAAVSRGAYLEPGPVRRKGVNAVLPWPGIARFGVVGIVLPVITHHLEHPPGSLNPRLIHKGRSLTVVIEQRDSIAVPDALEVAVSGAAVVLVVSTGALMCPGQRRAGAGFLLVAFHNGTSL